MRKLAEAQQLRAPGSAVLLLGLVLGTAAGLNCTGDTYPKDGRCCSECPPGEWPGLRTGEGYLRGHGDGDTEMRWGTGHGDGDRGRGRGGLGTCRWGLGTQVSRASGLRLVEWVTCTRPRPVGRPEAGQAGLTPRPCRLRDGEPLQS